MSKIPLEDLLPKSDWSIYRLARMASIRAMELAEGRARLTKETESEKEATIALEEIYQGLVVSKEACDKFPTPEDKKVVLQESVEEEKKVPATSEAK